jgi:DNA-binding transcriptional ArsR family regulator
MVEDIRMRSDEVAIPKPRSRLEIHGLDALKMIADPLRLRLVEALRQSPATVKELAARMAVPPKSLYYHVGLLEQHGLVEVVDSRLVSGILEKTYQATAYLFVYTDLQASKDGADPRGVQAMASSFFTITNEEIMESVRDGVLVPATQDAPIEQTLQSVWQLLRLNATEAREFGERIQALLEEYGRLHGAPRADARTYRVLYTMFPVQRVEDGER